jgi:hypothetical protein
LLGLNLTAFDP